MTQPKSKKTYLPLPEKDEAEPPTTGDGFWFTDALDENDPVTARKILVAQFDIPPDQAAHLQELFEHPASSDNMTVHRLEVRQRKRGALSKAVKEADYRLDLNALGERSEKAKLEALLVSRNSIEAKSPFYIRIIRRKRGRRLKMHKDRINEFTMKLRLHANPHGFLRKITGSPQNKAANGQGAKSPKMMKQIVHQIGESYGGGKTTVYKKFVPKKKQFKPNVK